MAKIIGGVLNVNDSTGNIEIPNGLTVTGAIAGSNLSGTNTGDQDLSGYALLSGANFTGNVGIANASPEEKLHVGGAIAISRGAFNSFITGANIHDPRIYSTGNAGTFPFNEVGTLVIQPRVSSATGSRIAFVTNNGTAVDTRMTILANGNVGIGNTNPLAALDLGTGAVKTINTNVVETYLEGTGLRMKNIYTGAGWARNLLTFEDSAGTDYFGIGALGTGQTFNYLFIGPAYNDTWMVVRNTNVGIGTAAPASKLSVYGGLSVGTYTTAVSDGNIYATGNVSALSFTDRTPHYDGDAVAEIKAIRGVDGQIDHSTLPAFAKVTKEVTVTPKPTEPIDGEAKASAAEPVTQIVEERDLGAMISILTKAVQQLTERIEKLEGEK